MSWIDEVNDELERRRNHHLSYEGQLEAEQRAKSWRAEQGGITTLLNKIGVHEPEFRHEHLEKLKNLERNEEWKQRISDALMGKEVSEETKVKITETLNGFYESLSDEEKQEKYSNDSSSRKSLKVRKEILDSIEGETFTTSQARLACEKYGLGNWKGLLKDKRLVEQIYKGTNQLNPSVYKKI